MSLSSPRKGAVGPPRPSVPLLVTPQRRARAFSVFYTGAIGIYGLNGGGFGVRAALLVIGAVVLIRLPLALVLRPALPAQPFRNRQAFKFR
jgi:hypothetical protein